MGCLRRVVLLGLMGLLAGCGVAATSETSYYFTKSANDQYELRLKVETNAITHVGSVRAIVDQVPHDMARSGDGPSLSDVWTYTHTTSAVTGLDVRYEVTSQTTIVGTVSSMIFPPFLQTLPDAGSFQIPILHKDSDIDGNLTVDRLDLCPFGPTPCVESDAALGKITFWTTNTLMRDNTGPVMFRITNTMTGELLGTIYAFKHLVTATATVHAWTITGAGAADKTFEVADCELLYVDTQYGSSGKFVQVFGAGALRPCLFSIKSGAQVLVEGHEVLFVVVTNTSGPKRGEGRVSGRITLKAPADDAPAEARALFTQITAQAPTRYMYFVQPNLRTTVDLGNVHNVGVEADFHGVASVLFRR